MVQEGSGRFNLLVKSFKVFGRLSPLSVLSYRKLFFMFPLCSRFGNSFQYVFTLPYNIIGVHKFGIQWNLEK